MSLPSIIVDSSFASFRLHTLQIFRFISPLTLLVLTGIKFCFIALPSLALMMRMTSSSADIISHSVSFCLIGD